MFLLINKCHLLTRESAPKDKYNTVTLSANDLDDGVSERLPAERRVTVRLMRSKVVFF